MKGFNSLTYFIVGYEFKIVNAFVPVQPGMKTRLCLMSKNSDRARVEKHLEELMDNDWRLFRANLVAQENIEVLEANTKRNLITHESTSNQPDEKKARQEKFGNIFAAIFNHHREQEKEGVEPSIFNGDAVGGASSSSMIPDSCEDPFVSVAEIPVLLKSKASVDKHRWAHPITHIEPGCVLVANEQLGGVFHQTIVLIIDHNEATGSTGIVINRPYSGDLQKIASENASNVDLSLKMAFSSAPVTFGGPVMGEEYSVLHGYGEVEGSRKVAPGVFVGGSEELMNEVRKRNLNPKDALFVKGHAAWIPDQLSREISKGVWYVASCSADLLLRYAGAPILEDDNKNDLWADVLTCMGDQYANIAEDCIGKGDRRAMP